MKQVLASTLIFLASSLSYAEFSSQSIESGCVNFSGIYLSDDPSAFESCIEIRQSNCKEYTYIWHLPDGDSLTQINKTDSKYRTYPYEPHILKSFTHNSDGTSSFKFYEKGRPEKVYERINTKLKNGNISVLFYRDKKNDPEHVSKSIYQLLNSVKACFR